MQRERERELDGGAIVPVVGTETKTRGRTICESDVVSFSALTGDWHPQHSDAEWAAASRFGERVAHGMLVLSYAVGLVPFDPDRVVALRGLESATFKRPVRIGDTISVRSRVEEVRELDSEHAIVTFGWRITNQAGQVVARVRVAALWRGEGHEKSAAAPAGTAHNGSVAAAADETADDAVQVLL